MKAIFKKFAVILGLVALVAAFFVVAAFAEQKNFEATAFSDLTPANGWVKIGSHSAKADEDGKDVELYFIKYGEAYFNAGTKTMVFLGTGSLTGNYGDWTVSDTKNSPGNIYYLVYWASLNSEKVEHLEFRECAAFNNGAFFIREFKHVKTVKLNTTANGTFGSKNGTGAFSSMSSLETLGHGTFAKDGKFTPISYKEGVVDMTGFTYVRTATGNSDKKTAMYHGGMFYYCTSITEVVMPKTMTFTGTYFPAVEKNGEWVKAESAIEAKNDEYGGEYAGVFAKNLFAGDSNLAKVTVPEGVVLKAFEDAAFSGCAALRCITVKGSVSPEVKVGVDVFDGVKDGCIIQCATQADIDNLNRALTAQGITCVKAVTMDTPVQELPYVTKLPVAPTWKEFDPAGATAYGEIEGAYTKNYWAYYEDTKTLSIISNETIKYNEVGTIDMATDGYGWEDYKTEIEHVIIGPKITKLTAATFHGMTNLKDIRITSAITQASGAFTGCESLTTIWIDGMERVEGQAMLAGAKTNFKLNFKDTAVKSIHMGSSPVVIEGNITFGAKLTELCFDVIPDGMLEYGKEKYINISNGKGEVVGNFYVEVPEGLPGCGDTSVFDFDGETGTLTILGKGTVADVGNYWGGGSKNQYWFSVKNDIKHVVITDHITAIGKYAFTECQNLETVEIPASSDFKILNAAFEKCPNLRAIYIRGNEPIIGTYDLSLLDEVESFTFSGNYRLVNVILSERVVKIGTSVFEECVNLSGVYGVPGSYAEEFAAAKGLTFCDKATNTPEEVLAALPAPEETTDTSVSDTQPDTSPETTVDTTPDTTAPETAPVGGDDQTAEEPANILPVVIIVAAVAVVAVVVVVVVVAKKRAKKN